MGWSGAEGTHQRGVARGEVGGCIGRTVLDVQRLEALPGDACVRLTPCARTASVSALLRPFFIPASVRAATGTPELDPPQHLK